jgi:hypothetical protein
MLAVVINLAASKSQLAPGNWRCFQATARQVQR